MIQHGAFWPSTTLDSDVSVPSRFTWYVVTELDPASTTARSPLRVDSNATGTAPVGAFTTGFGARRPSSPTRNVRIVLFAFVVTTTNRPSAL